MYRLNTRAGVLPRSASSHFNVSLSYICDVWQILPPLGFPNDVLPDVDPMHCELTIALQSQYHCNAQLSNLVQVQ